MPQDAAPVYQVLARKYRPETFADLVGQDAMVRTLKNAFAADRIAQAFIMTGIRGTGKTTTARIIAKGMNCIGPDGQGGPTTEPCGVCEHCVAISEGRHVDVLEMDAASRTGVNDIREIIESVHYRAASARYKIYIIDEVHMLSTSAFNALLKTLEEPQPGRYLWLVAAEPMRLPATIRSRCQRLEFRLPPRDEALAWLQSQGHAGKAAAEALDAARGHPGIAEHWLREGGMALRAGVATDLDALAAGTLAPSEIARRWTGDEDADARLRHAADLAATRAAGLTDPVRTRRLTAWFAHANRTRDLLRTTVRADLAVGELLLAWREAMGESGHSRSAGGRGTRR